MACLAVLCVLRKALWGSVPIKLSLGSTWCERMRKQAASVSQALGASGMHVQVQGLRAVLDLGEFFAQSQSD